MTEDTNPARSGSDGPDLNADDLRAKVEDALRTVYDPEIPVNIHELGLIYDIAIDETKFVTIQMTLTSPNCPEAEALPPEVEGKVRAVAGVRDAKVDLVWEPPWNKDMMSEAAKLDLGMY